LHADGIPVAKIGEKRCHSKRPSENIPALTRRNSSSLRMNTTPRNSIELRTGLYRAERQRSVRRRANVNIFDSNPFRRLSGAEMAVPTASGPPDVDNGRLEALVACYGAGCPCPAEPRALKDFHEMIMCSNYLKSTIR
jgi:hypothetical protein